MGCIRLEILDEQYRKSELKVSSPQKELTFDFSAVKEHRLLVYAYCMNNPLKYIDPTGMDVEIAGDENKNVVERLQQCTPNLVLTLTGEKLNAEIKDGNTPLTGYEQELYDAVKNTDVTARIELNIQSSEGEYHGTIYDKETGKATSTNQVNFYSMNALENKNDAIGMGYLHEISEGFRMGLMSTCLEKDIEGAKFQWINIGTDNNPYWEKAPKNSTDYKLYQVGHNLATPDPNTYRNLMNAQKKAAAKAARQAR